MESTAIFNPEPKQNRRKKRALISLLVLGALSTVISIGTLAIFTASSTYTSTAFAAAKVAIDNNSTTGTITFAPGKMIIGDTVTQTVDVANTGDTDILNYKLDSASVGAAAPLDAALRMWVARCSGAWSTLTAAAPTCTGTATNLVGSSAAGAVLTQTGVALGTFCRTGYVAVPASTCTATDADHFMVRVSLPTRGTNALDNALQGQTGNPVKFVFSGDQPAGQNR